MAFAAIAPALISGATSLIGGKMAADGSAKSARLQMIANAMAQEKRIEALGQQRQILQAAEGNQLDAITRAALEAAGHLVTGTSDSNDAYKAISTANAPGMARLRQAIADEGTLTPYQQAQIAEADRQAKGVVRSSSLAGGGRATAALLKKAVADTRMGALESNRQTALGAANTLAGNDNAARANIANNLKDQGVRLAGNINDAGGRIAGVYGNTASQISSAIGKAYGDNAMTDERSGQQQGQAASDQGKIWSQTAGAIGGAVADAMRGSKYSWGSSSIGTTPGSGGLY